jgi:hypothetical protein
VLFRRETKAHHLHRDEQNLLEGRAKNDFDKLMRDVMSIRNAFAHGKFSSDDKRVWLSYFEGKPRNKELSDDYLTEVEILLRKAFDNVFQLSVKIGATKLTESTANPA